jgi:hypothetical protein
VSRSKAVKIKIYIMMLKAVVVYGSEKWPMMEMDMKRMNMWERKILRRIPHILESNPHLFYSFRGLKNQMWIRFAV